MPVGNASYYNRRKYSPQAPPDHQSRAFLGEYGRPDGGSERSRSNGSISSVASCVSSITSAGSSAERTAAAVASDAVNGNAIERCTDSVGASGPECCVQRTVQGGLGEPPQQVASRVCVSESVTSAGIGPQRRVPLASVINSSGEPPNGPLLPSPGVPATHNRAGVSGLVSGNRPVSLAAVGSAASSGSVAGPGQVSNTFASISHRGSNDEFGSQLSPGPSSSNGNANYQLGPGHSNDSKPAPVTPRNPYGRHSSVGSTGPSHPSAVCAPNIGPRPEDNPFVANPPHSGGVNVNVTVNVVTRPAASTMTTTTATTTSTTTLAPPRPMQKVIPTVVYLMSRIAVHMEIEGTAQCPAQVMLAAALGCEELGITNKLLAQSVFGLWMTSPLLEVQLKPHHRPYAVRVAWSKLLDKHSHGNELEKLSDEPMTTLRRNVFFSRRDEEKIKDPRILELLYEEARHNVLLGRYVMEPSQSIMLGGIQARIELGPYNSHTHTTSYFRENQFRFLPAHVAKSSSWSWLPISQRSSAEVRLLEQFKRVPTTATTKKLMRKYLEFCWGLPFYGAAYFHGQVEQPVRGLMSLMQQKDLPVLIAVNERGIFVIDQIECTLLLGLKYEEFSWEYAKPSNVNDPECLPCIFLQFGAVENGIAATKLMQIFSRQAAMVDALITHFIEQDKRRKESGADVDQGAGGLADNTYVEPNPIKNNGIGVLSNKFSRLTLATFDDEGRCIGQTGSLSISY
ncbi:FERM domain-containing protein 8 [Anopheles nili]|uniref:FERM domain-containing protein 8 n=1 Tax=Anopheles nili TaxID=185578 RepID=UPI00237BEB9C|nr:FERM domain-containing protein 8 [Anopheles nili]